MKLNREEERPPAMNALLAQPIRLQLTLTRFPSTAPARPSAMDLKGFVRSHPSRRN